MPSSRKKFAFEPIIVDTSDAPRVSASLTVAALKRECKARRIKARSNIAKADLLDLLVDDTILLHATREYRAVEGIRQVMAKELSEKQETAVGIRRKRERDAEIRAEQRRAKKLKQEQDAAMPLHTIQLPGVHSCNMAPTCKVTTRGAPRETIKPCAVSSFVCDGTSWRCCVRCDFDACKPCVELHALPAREREAKEAKYLQQQRKEEARRREIQRREAAEAELRRRKEEKAQQLQINRITGVPKRIRAPPKCQRDQDNLLRYVVWSSEGYLYRRRWGGRGLDNADEKHFDSTFSAKKDTNARVKYIFYAKNPWGISVDSMLDMDVEEKNIGGLLHLYVCPPDGETWTVAAVPAVAFKHLSNVVEKQSAEDDSSDDSSEDENVCPPDGETRTVAAVPAVAFKHLSNVVEKQSSEDDSSDDSSEDE